MYGCSGKSVGYFPSFLDFYFCAKWLVYECRSHGWRVEHEGNKLATKLFYINMWTCTKNTRCSVRKLSCCKRRIANKKTYSAV